MHDLDPSVIHGDLKGVSCFLRDPRIIDAFNFQSNILVDDLGVPRICDFGLSRILGDAAFNRNRDEIASMFWLAPELYWNDFSCGSRTKASDVWAFGMTALEVSLCPAVDIESALKYRSTQVLTSQMPWAPLRGRQQEIAQIKLRLVMKDRPDHKQYGGISSDVWKILELCWAEDAGTRPSILDIKTRLRSVESIGLA